MKPLIVLIPILILASLAVASANNIRKVDFRNFSYMPACTTTDNGESQTVRVINGSFSGHTQGGADLRDFVDLTVQQVAYGDLTGDGQDEAVVVTICNTGGSGAFSEGFIYGIVDGKPKLLAVIDGGDRAFGGISQATVERGTVRVERFGTNGGACCPDWVATINYRLREGRLVPVGMERRRKYVETK